MDLLYYLLIRRLALKNADSFLQEVMKAVDTDRDGHISYSGTHTANLAFRHGLM